MPQLGVGQAQIGAAIGTQATAADHSLALPQPLAKLQIKPRHHTHLAISAWPVGWRGPWEQRAAQQAAGSTPRRRAAAGHAAPLWPLPRGRRPVAAAAVPLEALCAGRRAAGCRRSELVSGRRGGSRRAGRPVLQRSVHAVCSSNCCSSCWELAWARSAAWGTDPAATPAPMRIVHALASCTGDLASAQRCKRAAPAFHRQCSRGAVSEAPIAC